MVIQRRLPSHEDVAAGRVGGFQGTASGRTDCRDPNPAVLHPTLQPGAPDPRSGLTIDRPHRGNAHAPIVVLCDVQSHDAARMKLPQSEEHAKVIVDAARKVGLNRDDFLFIGLAPPYKDEDRNSAARKWKHVEQHAGIVKLDKGHTRHGLRDLIYRLAPKVVVTLGEQATRVMLGRAVAITKIRGVAQEVEHTAAEGAVTKTLLFPMLSPGYVARLPEHVTTFDADMSSLAKIKRAGFSSDALAWSDEGYEWVLDWNEGYERELATAKALAVDTETTGLRWHQPDVRVLTVQITPRPGRSLIIPLPLYAERWFPEALASGGVERAVAGAKRHLEGPIRKLGHGVKFDIQMLRKEGIELVNTRDDTQLMAFGVDENMMSKTLDDCVRVFVPEMAGYSDQFDQHIDKGRMLDVPPEDVLDEAGTVTQYGMRRYAGGDTDATFRLARALYPLIKAEPGNFNCYQRIQMPAIMVFANRVERYGTNVDRRQLNDLTEEVGAWLEEEYRALIRMVPAKLRRKCLNAKEKMEFTRPDFVREVLFGPLGFGLKPKAFTESTRDLPRDQRIPSTSTKDHLPYFVTETGTKGEFVTRLIEFQKAQTLMSHFLLAFPKYIAADDNIYPSYSLHKTNTGRSASADPNGRFSGL